MRATLGWVLGLVVLGCTAAEPCPVRDPLLAQCSGICDIPGEEVCAYPGSGRGCMCSQGCWVDFYDGPCSPVFDTPPADAGAR